MSLSKTIIYRSEKEVAELLKRHLELDIIDEYGYTPLIQTAIVNSTPKAKMLLEAGATVDFTDLTGRTALFWAADNNNLELCKLLVKHGANVDAYSSGGQPILVMPILKRQHSIKKLLINSGASQDFAEDFLNAKLLGHSFELEGRVDIVDTKNTFIEVELEGFYLRFTLDVILSSLIDFKNNFGAKNLRKYFAKLDVIMRALQNAIELIRLQNYLVDIKQYTNKINNFLDNEPLVLPISFGGHAITLIRVWDWFIRCDRGEFGRKNGTVIFYSMRNPAALSKSFCRELLYKRQSPEYINTGLVGLLGLEPQLSLPLPEQKTGNCSWANAEAIIPALMFTLLHEERGGDTKVSEKEALSFYNDWREWNKTRALDFCLQSFSECTITRGISKAALLNAILFQACNYDNKQDRLKAEKILSKLALPQYSQVLKCYNEVFSSDHNNPMLKNFYLFLEDYGIDIDNVKTTRS